MSQQAFCCLLFHIFVFPPPPRFFSSTPYPLPSSTRFASSSSSSFTLSSHPPALHILFLLLRCFPPSLQLIHRRGKRNVIRVLSVNYPQIMDKNVSGIWGIENRKDFVAGASRGDDEEWKARRKRSKGNEGADNKYTKGDAKSINVVSWMLEEWRKSWLIVLRELC